MHREMERNIRLYPWYQATTSFYAWLPVFFLYFLQHVSFDQAIRLGAIYYVCVFLLEVPSGYFSDRIGRRPTLLLSAAAFISANVLFVLAGSFLVLAVAQGLLAAGMAFQSGSDTSLHYDSLALLNREKEYAHREANASRFGLVALALSCLIGGALGMIDLRLPYALSLIGSLAGLLMAWNLYEPRDERTREAQSFGKQLFACIRYLSDPVLAWLLAFSVFGYTLEHVPYEFYQPYLKLLGSSFPAMGTDSTPLVSGTVIAISMFGGALGALLSMPLHARLGLPTLLLLGAVIQCLIIAGLAFYLHPAMLMLVMFRNFPMAMAHGPLLGAIGPRISSDTRATYLSLQSLVARLGFSAVLFMLAARTGGGEALNWVALSGLLYQCLIVSIVGILMLALFAQRIKGWSS